MIILIKQLNFQDHFPLQQISSPRKTAFQELKTRFLLQDPSVWESEISIAR